MVDELWPVTARRRVELRRAMCADGLASVPYERLRARLKVRLAKVLNTLPDALLRW